MAEVKWDVNDLVNGDELLLYLVETDGTDKKVVAYATSCSVQVDAETIDVSSKFSGRWASNRNGRASYTISADALYVSPDKAGNGISFDALLDYMIKGKNIQWYMGREESTSTWNPDGSKEYFENPHNLDTNQPYYTGYAAVTSVSLEAGNNEIASCSITLTGAEAIKIENN